MRVMFAALLFLVIFCAPVRAEWVTVAKWEGRETITTEPFDVSAGEWRVAWEFEGEGPFARSALFKVFVYTKGGVLQAMAVDEIGSGKGDKYIRTGRGSFYLVINNVSCSWKVTVEEEQQQKEK